MHPREKRRRVDCMLLALGSNDYRLNRPTGRIVVSIPKKRGAPYGNKNAIGNKGGGAPIGNINAEKHGFYTNFGYRFQMMKIEESLMESGQYNVELVRDIAEKVKSGEVRVKIDFSRGG
ncbi:hypothetical protein SAMN04487821_1437 [Enterococcus malodoratus]|uniref:hypothetical protein n=1 Tax=Enterococcus malodoratus TaxID=71451 RepID=UPI0008D5975F|nr:hypothetical protein [Enterococcus malodoratus]SET99911.1 hypothetical protein SAMN04487821_1437 [Enterococcus malodoratus]